MRPERSSDVGTTPSPGRSQVADDFVPTEERVWRQRVQLTLSADDIAPGDPFGSDEEHAEFLADLYRPRHAGTA
jgi:hypothetical protein